MSPREIPIIPTPHIPVATADGVAEWRARLTELTVHQVPDGRHVVLRVDDTEVHRFRLSMGEAQHLAALLAPRPDGQGATA